MGLYFLFIKYKKYDADNIIKVLVAFIGTLYMLEFLVSQITKLDFIDIFYGDEVLLFFIYMVLPIGVIYSIVVYIVIYKKSSDLSNLLALFIQVIKFFTIALMLAIGIDSLLVDNINILSNYKNFNNSSSYSILVFILILWLFSFTILIIVPTKRFLQEKEIKKYNLVLIFILLMVPYLNHTLSTFDLFPKVNISSLINKNVLCRELSEIKIIKNKSCNSNKSEILEFRLNCINRLQ